MEEKIKVKDFAAELGISDKDLIRKLKELDIEVKTPASSISPAQAQKAKAYIHPENISSDEVMRKEIQPGLIVRRRRTRDDVAEPAEGSAELVEQAAQVSGASHASGTLGLETVEEPAMVEVAELTHAPSAKAQELVKEPARKQQETKPKQEGARIIRSSTPAESVAEKETAGNVSAPVATAVSGVSHTPEADETNAQEGIDGSNGGKNANDEDTHRMQVAQSDVSPATLAAQATEVATLGAPQTADPQAITPTEVKQEQPEGILESANITDAGGVSTSQEGKEANASARPEEKRRKKKTPIETPPARIIQHAPVPKPEPVISEPVREEKPMAAQDAGVEEKPRRIQPAASAVPEGDSKPSLLPPVSDKRAEGQDDMPDAPRRRPAPPAPQVRVISRPDPSAPPAPRPASREQRPGSGYGGYNAPGSDRYSRDARPSGQPGQPGQAGQFEGRDNRDNRDSRPPMNRTPRPAPAPGAFPIPVEDQSRKKRNKNRRTVDFPQGEGAGMDFSRRIRGMDEDEGQIRTRSRRSKQKKQVVIQPQSTQPMKAAKRKLRVEEAIRVSDMAHQMGVKSGEIIKVLFGLGVMATINNALDLETAGVVAAEFGYEVEKVGFSEDTYLVPTEEDAPEFMKQRPPVVTIMGHVDHGKTSLLDAIRKTNVTSGEAGGITQHIGAYHVKTKRGDIVFLDTPGHEAFTAMRARGAQVTDLVVLVVAADDGVMEQTREAINHSKAAGVPIMVAVNKIDKESANPDRVLRELAELGLQAESWGGDVVTAMVSAKARTGIDELLELIALQAEILELKANPDKPARGHIVEAKLDKGRGPVATVLIQEGTLHQGDAFVCGVFSGRVRALFNDQGKKVKEAGPSMPVEVQGFEGVPEAGEEFICLADEKAARRIAESRAVKQRERELAKESRVTLETFLSRSADIAEALTLNLVVKADVQGSLEAIIDALHKLSTEKVRINIIHGGAGSISETDIMLAAASEAIIIGFNVRPTAKVKDVAEQEHVDIRFYDIIYKLVDEIQSAMKGMLAPVKRESYLGQAEVRDTFSLPKIGLIAGCHVADGKLTRSAGVRLLRDGVVIYTGKISSLRRFKDDVKEVLKGYECGVGLENYHDIKTGDIIEAFEMIEEAATL